MNGSKKRWFSLAAPAATVAGLAARVRRWARAFGPELPPVRGLTFLGTALTKPVVAAATPAATVAIDLSRYRLRWRNESEYDLDWDACLMCGEGHPPPIDPCFNEIGPH